jgi:hypothetical protein
VQLNLSGYYMIWNNPPINVFNPPAGFGNTSFQTNGPSYHIKGFEAQLVTRPLDGLTVQAGFTYNDAKQSSAPLLTVDNPASANFGQPLTSYYKNGVRIAVQSPFGNIGDPTPFSPKVQADLRARYEWQGAAELKWFMTGGFSYTGPTYNEPSTYPSGTIIDTVNNTTVAGPNGTIQANTTILRYRMPGYATINASVGVVRNNWTISVFGENLTDSHASTFTSSGQFIKAETPLRPLTYGVKIGTSF